MNIEKINPFEQPEVVKEIVSVYREVFGGPPWNEGYRCPVCGKIVSLNKKIDLCSSCQRQGKKVLMVEYWPENRVLVDFYGEMLKPASLCLVAKEKEAVVGFIWGYEIGVNEKLDVYLEAPGLSKIISGNFFYLDDVAVLPEYQNRGIGGKLVSELCRNQSYKKILLRTLADCPMFKLIIHRRGKVVLPISRNRVIMSVYL